MNQAAARAARRAGNQTDTCESRGAWELLIARDTRKWSDDYITRTRIDQRLTE